MYKRFHKTGIRFPILTALSLLAGSLSASAENNLMSTWHDYARGVMQPRFDWAEKQRPKPPSVIARLLTSQPEVTVFDFAIQNSSIPLTLGFTSSLASESPNSIATLGALNQVGLPLRSGLAREELSFGIAHTLDDDSRLTAAVLVANQQFASFGFGTERLNNQEELRRVASEKTVGTGVQLGYQQALAENLSWSAEFQSRVNMESFQSYRGVFSDPGDFDIPAKASIVGRWSLTPRTNLSVSAQRVFYSDLIAFSSNSLPVQFLSLLGDSSSPEFKWRDLNIIGADIGIQVSENSQFNLQYSTQQQPEPSSALLLYVLSKNLTDENFALGFERRFERLGNLRLAVSYAPDQYFLGNMSALGDESSGAQIEAEAVWRVEF